MDLTGKAMMIVIGLIFGILVLAFLLFGTQGLIDRSSGIAVSFLLPFVPAMQKRQKKGLAFNMTTVIIFIAISIAIMLSIWFSFSGDFGKIGSDIITQVTTPFT